MRDGEVIRENDHNETSREPGCKFGKLPHLKGRQRKGGTTEETVMG